MDISYNKFPYVILNEYESKAFRNFIILLQFLFSTP